MSWAKHLLWFFLLGMLLSAVVGWWVYRDYRAFLINPLPIPSTGLTYRVERGASINTIAYDWKRLGLLSQPLYLVAYARINGLATQIKAGEYQLPAGANIPTLMDDIVTGRAIQYSLTIPEGWTFQQMIRAVWQHPQIVNTLADLDGQALMAKLSSPIQNPEGMFFPDTYYFPRGTTDLAFLQRAYQTMQDHLQAVWQQRAADLPLTDAYQALVLASIIEKETGLARERREIAGVFTRRLRKGMLLQTDPTVIYGLGDEFDGNLRRLHLTTDTPYNTYTRSGLPPTPIALPGLAALQAAVDPAPGDSLYFVATGDGGHVFSKTLREHNQAVRRYQR